MAKCMDESERNVASYTFPKAPFPNSLSKAYSYQMICVNMANAIIH